MALCDLMTEDGVRDFVEIRTKLLKWAWLVYAKEYIADIRALETTSLGGDLSSWSTTWQKAVERCQCSIYITVKLMLILQIVTPGQIDEYYSEVMADMTMVRSDEQEPDKHEPPVVSCRGLTQKGTACKKRPTDNEFCKVDQNQCQRGRKNQK